MSQVIRAMLHPLAVAALSFLMLSQAAVAASTFMEIQSQWDTTNFTLTGKAQVDAFEQLQVVSAAYTAANPAQAEGWLWRGIIDSSFAGAKGGLGALGLAKSARKYFDKAIEIDGDALQGAAYSSLGTLYYSVPGWPIGFGNDDIAAELLQKGLNLNPDGIDSNFFYAEFLVNQGKSKEALVFYRKALSAAPRQGRAVADKGRRQQAQAAIDALQK